MQYEKASFGTCLFLFSYCFCKQPIIKKAVRQDCFFDKRKFMVFSIKIKSSADSKVAFSEKL